MTTSVRKGKQYDTRISKGTRPSIPRKVLVDPFELATFLLEAEGQVLSQCDLNYIKGSIRSRSHKNLSNPFRDVGPDQRSADESRVLSQLGALFKKNASFGSERDRVTATWSAFHNAEKQCRITNKRLWWYMLHPERLNEERSKQISLMRSLISEVLGDLRTYLGLVPGLLRFTSGASESTVKQLSQAERKLCRVSGRCYGGTKPLVEALAAHFGGIATPRVTNFNRITQVPKQWDKNRTIAAEAVWSLPFQLTVDAYVKRRLKLVGIDLTDQSRNQKAAFIGSLDNSIATVDLSAASDTVSQGAVDLLLPQDWNRMLRSMRAPFWRANGETGVYSKFSSMGNGYTFVLETLIFYAACHAVGASFACVYGDDIAISTEVAGELLSLLRFLGFTPNVSKTFTNGPFRESCGCDYHSGRDIRPYYLRSNLLDRKDICGLVNGLMEHGHPGSRLWAKLRTYVHDLDLPLIPFSADNSTCGVFTTFHHTKRYDPKLQRLEHKVLQYATTPLRRIRGDEVPDDQRGRVHPSELRSYWYRLFQDRIRVEPWLRIRPVSAVAGGIKYEVLITETLGGARTTQKVRGNWAPWPTARDRDSPDLGRFDDAKMAKATLVIGSSGLEVTVNRDPRVPTATVAALMDLWTSYVVMRCT